MPKFKCITYFYKEISRGRIAIDAYINGLKGKRITYHNGSKNVLIIFQQVFGDAVVFSRVLKSYTELYSKEDNYTITFIARPSVISFMRETVPMDDSIIVQPVDFKRLVEDYKYYKETVNKYRDYAEVIIVPGSSLSAEILSCACNADRKIGLVRSVPVKKPLIHALFYRLAYTEPVVPAKEDMMLQRHRILLNYLGLKNYKATVPVLLHKERVVEDEHYAVCCPGSSVMEKCWPGDRFGKVIDYIIENFGFRVHLCGGKDEIQFEKAIFNQVKNPQMIISHIGKTDFSDWSAIVQHADLVIGNDSATMHLAAAARVPAVCIAGVYDKYQFFPYKVDILEEGDRLPVAVYKDMPCEWCRTRGYNAGYGNKKCKNRINKGQCASCIDKISVEEVIKAINQIMESNECENDEETKQRENAI